MTLLILIVGLHVASTCFMLGIIWFVQIVHYPLLAKVGSNGFAEYEEAHCKLTTFVVAPAMLIEAATAVWLFYFTLPTLSQLLIINMTVLGVIWLSTYALQVPAHSRLASSFDAQVHRRLVHSNWIRTILWSARTGIVFLIAFDVLKT